MWALNTAQPSLWNFLGYGYKNADYVVITSGDGAFEDPFANGIEGWLKNKGGIPPYTSLLSGSYMIVDVNE